jgi:hypothetical protein
LKNNYKKGKNESIMTLQSVCMNNLVEIIKNLPPLLKEEVLGKTMKDIKDEVKQDVIKEIRRSASIVVEDLTDHLISSHKTGQDMKRPEYTNDLDDGIYYTFIDISEQFVKKHIEKIVFDNHMTYQVSDSDDSDQDYY